MSPRTKRYLNVRGRTNSSSALLILSTHSSPFLPSTSMSPTSATVELGHTSGLCRGPAFVCSQMRGTETSATAGEGYRSAALPSSLAQQGALDLLVQLSAGGRLLVSAAGSFGWTPRVHLGVCGSFLSHPFLCLPPASAWCGPLVSSHNEFQE